MMISATEAREFADERNEVETAKQMETCESLIRGAMKSGFYETELYIMPNEYTIHQLVQYGFRVYRNDRGRYCVRWGYDEYEIRK